VANATRFVRGYCDNDDNRHAESRGLR
jgi:hypothetical protein